jgi:Na+/phosphate symporter
MQANQISEEEYEELDELHYQVENQLLKLIKSLQKKQKDGQWQEIFQPEE